MTGAAMPHGADSVVIVEQTESAASRKSHVSPRGSYVKIFQEVKRGANVRRAGEGLLKGEVPLKKGALIRPQEMGMLASLGLKRVEVFKRPRVAILTTGSELVGLGKKLGRGKVRSSNTYTLYGQAAKYGGEPVNLGIAKDNLAELRRKIKKGTAYDMLVISGGVSVGVYDFVKDVLKELGKIKFWRVRMKPGKPLVFGLIRGIPVFGLPGNPVSSMVTFEEFVKPAISKMRGARELDIFNWCAILKEDIYKRKGVREYIRVALKRRDGDYYAYRAGPHGSGILKSMVLADGLLAAEEGKSGLKKGEVVYIRPLR